jgi:hypothetical protein
MQTVEAEVNNNQQSNKKKVAKRTAEVWQRLLVKSGSAVTATWGWQQQWQ